MLVAEFPKAFRFNACIIVNKLNDIILRQVESSTISSGTLYTYQNDYHQLMEVDYFATVVLK